jgi:hypothetical protein
MMSPWPLEYQFLGYMAFAFLITVGGNWVCRWILAAGHVSMTPPGAAPDGAQDGSPETHPAPPGVGRFIGSLERLVILLGLSAQSWEVLLAVIALKTVARYKELDRQIRAEYFLVGSLTSLLWALIVTLAALWFDRTLGSSLALALNVAQTR